MSQFTTFQDNCHSPNRKYLTNTRVGYILNMIDIPYRGIIMQEAFMSEEVNELNESANKEQNI